MSMNSEKHSSEEGALEGLDERGSQGSQYESSSSNQDDSQKESLTISFDGSVSALTHGRPPGEDDVNYSFLALLGGLSMYDDTISSKIRWSPRREEFMISRTESSRAGDIITARTDGCLKYLKLNLLEEQCPTLAILEVKARRRNNLTSRAIQIQEGAEMAAWISSQPTSGLLPTWVDDKGTYRRVILSQDFNEIYLTVASYPQEYVDFITGRINSIYRKSTPESPLKTATLDIISPSSSSDIEMDDASIPSSSPMQGGARTRPQDFGSRPQTPTNQEPVPSPKAPIKLNESQTRGRSQGTDEIFLTMHQYKPFKITEKRDMKELITLLIFLVRKLCHEYDRSHAQGN
ncbi:hypothetical protein V8C37DRAFT_385296 [Trichoderma ceciliae]